MIKRDTQVTRPARFIKILGMRSRLLTSRPFDPVRSDSGCEHKTDGSEQGANHPGGFGEAESFRLPDWQAQGQADEGDQQKARQVTCDKPGQSAYDTP